MAKVKICGVTDPENLKAACNAGARFIGFVFYKPSPRNVSLDIACNLAREVPTGVRSVGLFVDPDDDFLEHIIGNVQIDMIQLHGNESPERITEIKDKFKMPIIKAIHIYDENDLDNIEKHESVADWLLFDAKSDNAQGGTGESFDWSLLENHRFTKKWMLSGGLTSKNICKALKTLNPDAVDVSSGVEAERGVKDPQKIREFIEAVESTNAYIK